MIVHLFLFYGHRCSHFVMLSVCPHITSLTNGLSRVAELGQESRAPIRRGQSTSAPFKWSGSDYDFVNQWVGNQRGSTSAADQGGGFASECSQGLSKVDSPCWVKSKDNMTDLKFQVCFLTFSRISFPFPMTKLTLFPYGPQIWFWSPRLVCSDLTVTGISELILVSDVSHKKTFTHLSNMLSHQTVPILVSIFMLKLQIDTYQSIWQSSVLKGIIQRCSGGFQQCQVSALKYFAFWPGKVRLAALVAATLKFFIYW